jgi:four helix bundle protein
MYSYSFEKLEVWQLARQFVRKVYDATKEFPPTERFGIVQQIRKAAVSVCSNIAEGSGRITSKDKAHFYAQAFTSLMESLNQLIISNDQSWITNQALMNLRLEIDEIAKRLSRLRQNTQRTA